MATGFVRARQAPARGEIRQVAGKARRLGMERVGTIERTAKALGARRARADRLDRTLLDLRETLADVAECVGQAIVGGRLVAKHECDS